MLGIDEQLHIKDLFKQGLSAKQIVDITGKNLNTVYKYRKFEGKLQAGNYHRKDNTVSAEHLAFQEQIDQHIKRRKLKPNAVYVTLQQQGYQGNLAAFTSFYKERKQLLRPKKELQHIETGPGEQAQMDWAHFGVLTIEGKLEKVYAFSYVLSWSREMYMEFVVRQNQKTLQECHKHAFEKLGIPKTIVYDNMKTVVNRREKFPDKTSQAVYNSNFMMFAKKHNFKPYACHPYYPQEKGKVEASFHYLRKKFVRCTPSMNLTLEQLNTDLEAWLKKAGQRKHGTTGEKPYERWIQEKQILRFPKNTTLYEMPSIREHHTDQYGIMRHRGNTYHLGQAYSRTKIMVREVQEHGLPFLEIYHDQTLIKMISIPTRRHSWVTVFEETDESPATIREKSGQKPRVLEKKHKINDVIVAQRQGSYYTIESLATEGGYHG